ncbi:DUF3180 domain-containing protein [Phytoactinopolyspora halotolerans]|uniref:DUF3180 domain-containing protein n=1 Tax=Phytoactinopolyspora halotolerans TaxID=1981512 RepID=A0A6L9S179_9ACTN|nr:DUF3180 domain-containing protein [Phytoactinopolyspora halotolerans]NED98738.1 DUF3180 domain-containing protein [Phytoactinopolyspora halotolerans]
MQKTKIATLVWVALLAAPIGWSISRVIQDSTRELPPVPVVLPVLLALLAAFLFFAAREIKAWIRERRHDRHIGPLRVARTLALAKAAEFFGAALTGAYLGLATLAIDHLTVPMGRDRLLMAGLVVGAGTLATVAAVVLERACIVPPGDDEHARDAARED